MNESDRQNIRFDVRHASWQKDRDALSDIRCKVFVEEQNVPIEIELDGEDECSEHFLAELEDGTPIGAARLMSSGQIGRMAVLRSYRKYGVGRQLLLAAVSRAKTLEYAEIFLHAQTQALGFYERSGFEPHGPEFDDAGIPHRAMKLKNISED